MQDELQEVENNEQDYWKLTKKLKLTLNIY